MLHVVDARMYMHTHLWTQRHKRTIYSCSSLQTSLAITWSVDAESVSWSQVELFVFHMGGRLEIARDTNK